jgi:hypothetical protein
MGVEFGEVDGTFPLFFFHEFQSKLETLNAFEHLGNEVSGRIHRLLPRNCRIIQLAL